MARELQGNRKMRAQPIDRRIAKLLNDPLTSLVIEADGVDRARLAAQLRRLAGPGRAETAVRRGLANLSSRFGVSAP